MVLFTDNLTSIFLLGGEKCLSAYIDEICWFAYEFGGLDDELLKALILAGPHHGKAMFDAKVMELRKEGWLVFWLWVEIGSDM